MNQVNLSNQAKSQVLTMFSQDISELTDKRHDNVKRTIESLVSRGVIQLPQIEEVKNHLGQMVANYVFKAEQGKRDSIIVVAQLCPEFTARLVDRWQELEQQAKSQAVDLSNPHALRRALLDYTEQVIELEAKNHSLEHTVKTITSTCHAVKFQQACKILSIKQPVLAKWLRSHGWDRQLNNARASTYYSEERGYCETKYSEVVKVKENGELGSYTRIDFFILPKGMQVLAKHFGELTE